MDTMEQRVDFFKASPEAMKALTRLGPPSCWSTCSWMKAARWRNPWINA